MNDVAARSTNISSEFAPKRGGTCMIHLMEGDETGDGVMLSRKCWRAGVLHRPNVAETRKDCKETGRGSFCIDIFLLQRTQRIHDNITMLTIIIDDRYSCITSAFDFAASSLMVAPSCGCPFLLSAVLSCGACVIQWLSHFAISISISPQK
jgi:hypothetical protein